EDPPIDAPVISVEYKPLNLVTMAQLRARYTELTGKRVRVGVSKKGIQELIIAARRVSNS
ncbi:MAG: hypothetical protein OEX14_04945, partial [Paracoccaceae bacterium]|nr:hypothetical protein [Paracoccaceae bacterium]